MIFRSYIPVPPKLPPGFRYVLFWHGEGRNRAPFFAALSMN